MNNFISNWLRPDIKAINAYHVPASENMVKLDAMESPFPLSDKLIEQYSACLANAQLNRYPNPNAIELQQALRALMDIPADCGVLLGNGSDELIQLINLKIIVQINPLIIQTGKFCNHLIHYKTGFKT
jgi:histidinol-phosphate aminotransferase